MMQWICSKSCDCGPGELKRWMAFSIILCVTGMDPGSTIHKAQFFISHLIVKVILNNNQCGQEVFTTCCTSCTNVSKSRPENNNKNILNPTEASTAIVQKKSKLDHPEFSQLKETRDMCCQAIQQCYTSPHEDSESITTCVKSARTLILLIMWREG